MKLLTGTANMFGYGYIYIIRCADFFKLGFAKNWKSRFKQYKFLNPLPLTCEGLFEGTTGVERELLRALNDHRHQGEWFHIAGLQRAKELLEQKSEYELDWRSLDVQKFLDCKRPQGPRKLAASVPVFAGSFPSQRDNAGTERDPFPSLLLLENNGVYQNKRARGERTPRPKRSLCVPATLNPYE